MKTITYNTEKEIRIGIMIAVIISAVFTTFKVRELQLNDTTSAEVIRGHRIEMTNSSFATMPLADAKLIEEPAQAAEITGKTNAVSVNGNEIAFQMKTWMNSKAYWIDEQVENEEELANYMTTCLKNGAYFSDAIIDEFPAENEKDLTLMMISNLKNGSYFSDEPLDEVPAENKAELCGQMKVTLASGNYWSGDYK